MFGSFLVVGVLALISPNAGPAETGATPQIAGLRGPCDGPDADPWVRDLRDRVMTYDGLGRVATEQYGVPLACEGSVSTEFDGVKFGFVLLSFTQGVVLKVETMPPETSVVLLRSSSGFDDEGLIIEALQRYTSDLGLSIDWTAPQASTNGDERVETFSDPDTGLNASASIEFTGGVLVAVRVTLAL